VAQLISTYQKKRTNEEITDIVRDLQHRFVVIDFTIQLRHQRRPAKQRQPEMVNRRSRVAGKEHLNTPFLLNYCKQSFLVVLTPMRYKFADF
jgi:hypothetical protein